MQGDTLADTPGRFYESKARTVLDAVFGMVALYFVFSYLFPGKNAAAPTRGVWVPVVLFLLVSMFCFVSACRSYAASKGYPRRFALLGLLTFVGFVVMVLLPDRTAPTS
jgi:hypothetical protein